MSDVELERELLGLNREGFNLRIQKRIGQLTQTSQVRELRRNVARIKAIMHERRRT